MTLHHLPVLFIFFLLYTYTKATLPQLCYVEAGVLAPEYIHPCWTSFKTPHYSCCKVGNKCLEQNACYDLDTGNTYLYGCTDPEYKDERCPSKCGTDHNASNWVGLVYCNGEYDRPYYTWVSEFFLLGNLTDRVSCFFRLQSRGILSWRNSARLDVMI